MDEAYAIKDSLKVELSDYSFGLDEDGKLQSVNIQTEDELDIDTMKDIVTVIDESMSEFRLDVDLTNGRIRARV